MDLLNEIWREFCQYLYILWRRRWVCIAVGVLPWLVAGIVFLVSPRLYKSSALLALSPTSMESQFFLSLQQWGRLQYLSNSSPMHTLKEMMTSEPCVESVLEELSWKAQNGERVPPNEFVDAALPKMLKHGGGLRVRFDANAEVFEVTGYALELEKSALLANALCEAFLHFMAERNKQEAEEAIAALKVQLPELETRIQGLEREVQAFRTEHGFLEFTEEMERLISLRSSVMNENTLSQRSLEEAQANVKDLRVRIGEIPEFQEALVVLERNPLYSSYGEEMIRVESRLALLRASAQDNHPDVAACEAQLAELERKMQHLVQETFRSRQTQRNGAYDELINRLYSAEIQIVTQQARGEFLGDQLTKLAKEMQDLSLLQSEWDALSRKRDALVNRQLRLLEARETAFLAKQMDVANAFQFQRARTDLAEAKEYKSFPKVLSLTVIAGTFSVFFAFLAGLLTELVDPRVVWWDRVSDLLEEETVLDTKIHSTSGMGWHSTVVPGLHGLLWQLEEGLPKDPGPRGIIGVVSPLGTPGHYAFCRNVSLALKEAGIPVTWVELFDQGLEALPSGHLTIQDALRGKDGSVYEPVQGLRWIGWGEGDLPFLPMRQLVRSLEEIGSPSDVMIWSLPPLTQGSISESLLGQTDLSVLLVHPRRTLISRLRVGLEILRRLRKPRLIVSVS